uniref:Uncharacterized protein n=1 Tax=Ixodes ricinus TaxID=34613 RepID=A0A0K8R909_IXORI
MRLQLFMLTVGCGAIFCVTGDGERETQNSVETTTFDLSDDELASLFQSLGRCTYHYIDYGDRKVAIGCLATCGQTETSLQSRAYSDESEENPLQLSDKPCILVTGNITCENGTVIQEGYLGTCTNGICKANETGPLITILGTEKTELVTGPNEEDEGETKINYEEGRRK